MLNQPLIAACSAAGFRTRRPVEGPVAGHHRSPLHGLSPEFVDYRNYTPGDDPKTLDWKAHARSDRFYIKRYEEESNLRAFLVVDDSASMAYESPKRKDAKTKFRVAGEIATALAAACLKQRDAVGLMTASRGVTITLRPSAAGSQLTQVVDKLTAASCSGETDLVAAISEAADRVPRRSAVIVISDFFTDLDSLQQVLGKFRFGGHELICVQILDRDEIDLPFNDSVIFKDIEGSEELFAEPWAFRESYSQAMTKYRDDLAASIRAAGYSFWPVVTDDDLPRLVPRYLHEMK